MVKARKFKRKLGLQKPVRKKANQVLSVELIRKEYISKIKDLYQKCYKFIMRKSVIS